MKILVLPDSHAKHGVPNDRYDWLARMILDIRPEVVVDLGDFADVPALSAYDKGKKKAEGKRVDLDIEAAVDARRRLTEPLKNLHFGLESWGRVVESSYTPRLIALGGNHEQRVDRYMNDHPELYGMMSQDISEAEKQGWEWYPFLQKVTVEGVTFCHFFHNEMGKPLSGVSPARTLINKLHVSSVAGHSHIWDHHSQVNGEGKRLHGLVAGCYFEHHEDYAVQSNERWDRCITILHDVKNGDFDLEKISIERIKKRYGD